MRVPQASIFTQTAKGMSDGSAPMAAPTDAQACEFTGLINQETGPTGDLANTTDQNMHRQSGSEEEVLSPEELSAIAGMISGVLPNISNENSLLSVSPEGPTGSLLAPAALGGIPALSYALTPADGELSATVAAANTIDSAVPLTENVGAPLMEASATLGKPVVGEQTLTKQPASANKAAITTLNALKSSVSTDSLKLVSNDNSTLITGDAIQTANVTGAEQFQLPHQALHSALDAHLSAHQSGRDSNTPTWNDRANWAGNVRPQMPRGTMEAHLDQSNSNENILGEVPQVASHRSQMLSQAKGNWAERNQSSQARINTAENITDIKSEKTEGDIPDLPLAARIIQRRHYAHNMIRPNQSTNVEIDPALTVDNADTSITENPEMAISEIYAETAAEASEMMTPEGIVRAPTNMQIDIDGDLSVEIEAIGNEVHVTLDGTKSALDDMKGVRAEIADSLEQGEMDLGEFATTTRDGEQNESNKANSSGLREGEASSDSADAIARATRETTVQHGSSISAVA